ncbi:FAD-binding oxidoreductase [Rhizobium sp. TH2]|uniref:NAD(P)/FAD-dependent oxidoreductase n=1 Tax=Rhizobium sp. TH2 TaxID=2775403 RepID=UPI002158169A|nr:FAD-binding oxidoreductase [Rhizobium sp. TH2]UVC10283.1 FAD-binding oxidoreductase [Rhizobium sp. TH2]
MASADNSLSGSGQLSTDMLVIGGGIMGLWGAVKAADAGFSVILIDAGEVGRGASGGLLGALFPWMPDRWDQKKQYQFDALVSLPDEIARLEHDTGLNANFRRAGRIVPLPKPHLREIALRHQRDAETNWHQGGYRFHWHVRDGEPEPAYIDPTACAAGYIHDTLAARVEPRALMAVLKTWLLRQPNVRIFEHASLERLDAGRGRAEIVAHPPLPCRASPPQGGRSDVAPAAQHTPPISPLEAEMSRSDRWGYSSEPSITTITFSHALIAAGAASFPILQSLMPPLPKPLGQGVKGQAALLKADLDPTLPVVFLDGVYVVPHEGGFAAIGSTSENQYDDPLSTDRQLDTLIENARALIPALRDAEVVERWAGIRPKAIGRDPLVGPVPGHANIIALTGGFKISFGMAHRLADSALDHLLGRSTAPLPENFTLSGQISREIPG